MHSSHRLKYVWTANQHIMVSIFFFFNIFRNKSWCSKLKDFMYTLKAEIVAGRKSSGTQLSQLFLAAKISSINIFLFLHEKRVFWTYSKILCGFNMTPRNIFFPQLFIVNFQKYTSQLSQFFHPATISAFKV